MILHRKDIAKIQEILEKFPEVYTFELEQESGSGIGTIVTMIFKHNVNGVDASVSVEISGVEDW